MSDMCTLADCLETRVRDRHITGHVAFLPSNQISNCSPRLIRVVCHVVAWTRKLMCTSIVAV